MNEIVRVSAVVFEKAKLAELTGDDIEMYLRGRLKQRVVIKTRSGSVEKGVLKATTVRQELRVLRPHVECGGAQETPLRESVRRSRIPSKGGWALPAALHNLV